MTRPLRSAHRRIWIVLAALLPLLFAAGLAARRQAAENPGFSWRAVAR